MYLKMLPLQKCHLPNSFLSKVHLLASGCPDQASTDQGEMRHADTASSFITGSSLCKRKCYLCQKLIYQIVSSLKCTCQQAGAPIRPAPTKARCVTPTKPSQTKTRQMSSADSSRQWSVFTSENLTNIPQLDSKPVNSPLEDINFTRKEITELLQELNVNKSVGQC